MSKTVSSDRLMNTELDPRIKIRAPLRCDGVGSLDCAEDVESGMRMAVRWLPLDANGAAAARAVEALPSHPTLPKIRSTGRVGSAAFVAMDFPDGKLLATVLGEPFKPYQVAKLGAEIADALATMHAQDVVHGELSADSILLHGNKAVLWDMPLVLANRLTDRRGEERMLSQLPRIAPYLAPERARGVPAFSSGDIFALGAILAQLIGAKQPQAPSTLALLNQLGSGVWKPEVPEDAPSEVRAILTRMLHQEPRARPTAREVADHLRAAFGTPAVTAPELAALHVSKLADLVDPELAALPTPAPVIDDVKPMPEPVAAAPAPVVEAKAEVAQPAEPVAAPAQVIEATPSAVVPVEMRASIAPTNPEAIPMGARMVPETPKKSKTPWLVVSGVASAIILTLSALLYFAPKQTFVDVKPTPAPEQTVVALAPTTLVEDEPDMLEPLVTDVDDFEPHADPEWVASAEAAIEPKQETKPTSAVAIAAKEMPKGEKKVARQKPAKKLAPVAHEKPASVVEQPAVQEKAPEPINFDFLDKGAPPPSGELKRPSF